MRKRHPQPPPRRRHRGAGQHGATADSTRPSARHSRHRGPRSPFPRRGVSLRYSLFLGGLAHPKARTMPSCVCFRKSCISVLSERLGAPWGNIWDWLLDKVHAN